MTGEPIDFLGRNISELPYFRGLLRAVEARTYQSIELTGPILDLGCGDGHFASVTFSKPLDVGIDPWTGPVRLAGKTGAYRLVVHGSGNQMPFPDASFNCIVSNSVLEHIPDLDTVIAEASRVGKPGATFVFCVPNHNFLPNLSVARFFDRLHWKGLASLYRRFFNRISRHFHCDPPEVWKSRLEAHGFTIQRYWHYFSPKALAALEWGHYFGFPSLILHFLTRRWIVAPYKWNFALIRSLLQPLYDEPVEQENGAYSFYIARKG